MKPIFLPFPFFFLMDMVLAVHQSLSSAVSSCGAKSCSKASCFSFGHSDSICYYDEFVVFFSRSSVQKAPVCLICNGCFQLPLAAMNDGKTIKRKRAPQCAFFFFFSFLSMWNCVVVVFSYSSMHVFECLFHLNLLSASP